LHQVAWPKTNGWPNIVTDGLKLDACP